MQERILYATIHYDNSELQPEIVATDCKIIHGFMTSNNRFVDRSEAFEIAQRCDQIRFKL